MKFKTDIIQRYKNGESAISIAKNELCGTATIYRYLEKNNIERRSFSQALKGKMPKNAWKKGDMAREKHWNWKGGIKIDHPKEYKKKQAIKAKGKPITKFSSYKNSAKVRGLCFDLTFEQFMAFWQNNCYYCGDKVETIGLDRVDNSKGYFLGNIVSCCWSCNHLKGSLGESEFLNMCGKIVKFKNSVIA